MRMKFLIGLVVAPALPGYAGTGAALSKANRQSLQSLQLFGPDADPPVQCVSHLR